MYLQCTCSLVSLLFDCHSLLLHTKFDDRVDLICTCVNEFNLSEIFVIVKSISSELCCASSFSYVSLPFQASQLSFMLGYSI